MGVEQNGIQITNISKSFGDKKALAGFSARIPFQTVTAVMGPSGSGKTTLAKILAGLILPDSGEIKGMEGHKLSMVFQEDRLLSWYSCLKNISIVTRETPEDMERCRTLLQKAGLANEIDSDVESLSGGMKRRTVLCRALAADYDLLLLDEAFKGLDPVLKTKMMDLTLSESKGKTVVTITHDPAEAAYMSKNILYL